MLNKLKKIRDENIDKMTYIAIILLSAGFIINGCILEISKSISNNLFEITDGFLFLVEGIIITFSLILILLKNPKRTISIYSFFIALFLISYLLFPQNEKVIVEILREVFLYSVTTFILFLEISKDKNGFQKMIKITKIIFAFSIIYLIILILKKQSIYNVWLSRHFFITAIFTLYDLYRYKNKRSGLISCICFISILITGSRTYLVMYIVLALVFILLSQIENIKKLPLRKKIIFLIVFFVLIISYKKIFGNIYDFFIKRGIDIRIMHLIATGNFFTSNERINIIYPTIFNLIKENWIIGIGICGDRLAIYNMYEKLGIIREGYSIEAYYSHNLLLELFATFGVIVSTIIIIFAIYSIYVTIKKNKNNIDLLICLFCISVLPLMLNGTFWNNTYFWAFIAILFSNFVKDKKEDEKEKKDKKIIMLLDNAFDPDIRVYKEAKYLVDNGIKVKIICLDRKNKYKNREYEDYDGIEIKRIFCRTEKITKLIEKSKIISKLKYIIYFFWLIKFIYKTKKYLNNEDFEILHCHDLMMAFMGCCFFKDKKIVFDMHEYYGDNDSKLNNFFINKIVAYTQNKSNWIIYVNEYQKSKCKEKNQNKLIEIPNYPEKKTFKDIAKTESSNIRISYIGKVRDFNSLSAFIDSAEVNNKIDIAIYGDGSDFERLLNYAKGKGQDHIMRGEYNGIKEAENIYKNTDILYAVYDINAKDGVNWKNAMPIKSYEAIITLTPIIAKKNTVLGNFIEKNDIGFTIDDNELNELLEKIINNPNLIKDKYDNMKKIQYLFIWENVIKNIDKIYFNN